MLYFQVLPKSDQFRTKGSKSCDFLVRNELYTANEVLKLGVSPDNFRLVTVPKNSTYYFFGARFSPVSGTYKDSFKN